MADTSLQAPGRLDHRALARSASPCKVCGSPAVLFDVVDFNKHCSHEDFYTFGFSGIRVDYRLCPICDCIFTNFFDAWTEADFAERIYNADYIKVDSEYESIRPRASAEDLAGRWGDSRGARVLDYGSGTGAFADALRGLGYGAVESYDPFSSPQPPEGTFDIITCFEVIEHTPWPAETLRRMCSYLKPDGCIVLGQTLQPADILRLRGSWWYLAPRNGHICTFSANTLAYLAQQAGLAFHPGDGLHGFSRGLQSGFAKAALSTIGNARYFAPLFAPGGDAGGTRAWHGLENNEAGPFRWTAADTLRWPAPHMIALPATIGVSMPFIDQLIPEMLDDIAVSCGRAHGILRQQGRSLVAELAVEQASEAIVVRTRKPLTPRSIDRGPDDRALGIAVPVAPRPPG